MQVANVSEPRFRLAFRWPAGYQACSAAGKGCGYCGTAGVLIRLAHQALQGTSLDVPGAHPRSMPLAARSLRRASCRRSLLRASLVRLLIGAAHAPASSPPGSSGFAAPCAPLKRRAVVRREAHCLFLVKERCCLQPGGTRPAQPPMLRLGRSCRIRCPPKRVLPVACCDVRRIAVCGYHVKPSMAILW